MADRSERVGLCSVTLRALAPADVLRVAAEAGLRVVEWGGDVHAPPGRVDAVRGLTAASGLTTCSYGSYWKAGEYPVERFADVADAAVGLGAPRVRVWAGVEGSADASRATRDRVVSALREAAQAAAERGLTIALEFHGGTLADTPRATLDLLDAVDHPALGTYWQPSVDEPDEPALAGLALLRHRVAAVHVFSWWPGTTRLPLTAREGLWRRALDLLAADPVDLLLEFVPGDDPAVLGREAAVLLAWVDGRAAP
ncbi:sugar phosphate isomerase/epimerase family protein [Saccharothrix hoggarensis]|uniref:Sugar phosphate isomerase/epimerase family protein n=1 Tax=Saccharothrix hoggarensis TaxID=913853 RepID=A0ABW3R0Y6_9PSEU